MSSVKVCGIASGRSHASKSRNYNDWKENTATSHLPPELRCVIVTLKFKYKKTIFVVYEHSAIIKRKIFLYVTIKLIVYIKYYYINNCISCCLQIVVEFFLVIGASHPITSLLRCLQRFSGNLFQLGYVGYINWTFRSVWLRERGSGDRYRNNSYVTRLISLQR